MVHKVDTNMTKELATGVLEKVDLSTIVHSDMGESKYERFI